MFVIPINIEYFLPLFFVLIAIFYGWLNWEIDKNKDFKHLIEPQLEKFGIKYIKSEYPGIFKVGSFKKFEIEIGKPQINNGTIRYEKTYYRKITAITQNNAEIEIWAKIETSWLKEDTIEFSPNLKNASKNHRS